MIDKSRHLKRPSHLKLFLKCLHIGNSWSFGIFHPHTVESKNKSLLILCAFLTRELFSPFLKLLSDFCFLSGLWSFLLFIKTDSEPSMVWKTAVQMRHFHFILNKFQAHLMTANRKAVISRGALHSNIWWQQHCYSATSLWSGCRGAAQGCG